MSLLLPVIHFAVLNSRLLRLPVLSTHLLHLRPNVSDKQGAWLHISIVIAEDTLLYELVCMNPLWCSRCMMTQQGDNSQLITNCVYQEYQCRTVGYSTPRCWTVTYSVSDKMYQISRMHSCNCLMPLMRPPFYMNLVCMNPLWCNSCMMHCVTFRKRTPDHIAALNLKSEIWNIKSQIWNLKSESWNVKSGVWNLISEMWSLESEIGARTRAETGGQKLGDRRAPQIWTPAQTWGPRGPKAKFTKNNLCTGPKWRP